MKSESKVAICRFAENDLLVKIKEKRKPEQTLDTKI